VKGSWKGIVLLAAVLGGLCVAVPVLAGGFTGADAPSRIPIPAREFSATFEDTGGTSVSGSRVTFNGEVFVYGRYG